uniref:Kazal-like domain-containing protein n=1 Tax=Sus scrofa TaxID=9823 RepID=A0A8D2A5J8_PIG
MFFLRRTQAPHLQPNKGDSSAGGSGWEGRHGSWSRRARPPRPSLSQEKLKFQSEYFFKFSQTSCGLSQGLGAPEKMAFFSSRVRALFILVLVLPLCSETGFARSKKTRKEPDCDVYRSHLFFCTREMDPICGTNGKSYANPCIFCSEKLGRNEKFDFGHWGHCREYTSAARS